MAYTVKPSIAMLPLVDIGNALEIQGFVKNLSAQDIEKATSKEVIVDGQKIMLEGIAQAHNIAVSTGQIINGKVDRETIKNALNLNGVPASDYLRTYDKEVILNSSDRLNEIHSNEIQLLRDELYSLKTELIRTGHISDTDVGSGYVDGFKHSNIRYSIENTGIESVDNFSIKQSENIFNMNDWLVIKKDKNNDNTAYVATVMKETGNDIQVNISTNGMTLENSLLLKSFGEYRNGTYSFSKTLYGVPGVKERYTMLNDDVDLRESSVKKNAAGFATSIRIPSRNSGFLTKFIVQGRKIGNPGALTCYVFEGDAADIKEMGAQGKITEAIENKTYLAESLPIYDIDLKDKEIAFDFLNVDGQSTEYPEVIGGKEYSFVIKTSTASEDDYWVFEFGLNRGGDLQTNNNSFIFNEQKENTFEAEIVDFPDARDMFYTAVTRDKDEKSEIPYKEGLYTTSKFVRLPKGLSVSRARLTLEVNKEGNFMVTNQGPIRAELDAIEFKQIDGSMAEQTVIGGGDAIIVGNTIAEVKTSTPGTVTLDRNMYVDTGMPIYRCGYSAQIKTRIMLEDPETKVPYIKEGSERTFPLRLTSVIPNGRGQNSTITDRLVFEISFEDGKNIEYFNEAELQIKWNSKISGEIIRTQLLKGNDYVGRIHSMSLAFDKIV